MNTNKEEREQGTSSEALQRPKKAIYEAVIIDSYYGWDTVEVKSLGFFELWYDAASAADKWTCAKSDYRWPPYKWKIKPHILQLRKPDVS